MAVEKNTKTYGLDDQKLKASKAVINTTVAELNIAVENIQLEDSNRCLYSLNKSRIVEIKYPKFEGNAMEDFSKFERSKESFCCK